MDSKHKTDLNQFLTTTIKRWFADFKCGHTDTDTKFSRHPNEAINLENIKKIII